MLRVVAVLKSVVLKSLKQLRLKSKATKHWVMILSLRHCLLRYSKSLRMQVLMVISLLIKCLMAKVKTLVMTLASETYGDMVKAGIIDPALVTATALTNAASVSGLMLTTDVLITDLQDDEKPVAGAIS